MLLIPHSLLRYYPLYKTIYRSVLGLIQDPKNPPRQALFYKGEAHH